MKFQLVVGAVAIFACARAEQSIDECLRQDSISCVQRALYASAKEFFGRDRFEMLKGVSLVKEAPRAGKAIKYDEAMDKASSFAERQRAIENFVGTEIRNFLDGRSLKIDFMPALDRIGNTARALTSSIPEEIRQAADEVVEGRGRKKFMRSVMPLLMAAKLKLGVLTTFAYFSIAMLAKKAILASVVSIMISTFIGLKALWPTKTGGYEGTSYSSGWNSGGLVASSGWSSPGVNSGGWSSGGPAWDEAHGSYSSHNQAYTGYNKR